MGWMMGEEKGGGNERGETEMGEEEEDEEEEGRETASWTVFILFLSLSPLFVLKTGEREKGNARKLWPQHLVHDFHSFLLSLPLLQH